MKQNTAGRACPLCSACEKTRESRAAGRKIVIKETRERCFLYVLEWAAGPEA